MRSPIAVLLALGLLGGLAACGKPEPAPEPAPPIVEEPVYQKL